MPQVKVSVTAEELAHSPRSRYIEHDLFTRSLKRKGLGGVRVVLIQGKEVPIPEEALQLRARWERGEDIAPFEFELKW
jgi:hypothetical protein